MSVISLLLSMLGGQHLCTVFVTARYSENCMHCLLVRLTLLMLCKWSCRIFHIAKASRCKSFIWTLASHHLLPSYSLFAEVAKCNIVSIIIMHPWIAIKLLSLKCSPDCGFLTKQALWKSKGTWLMQLRMWRNCRNTFTEISMVDSIFRITPRQSSYRNYSIFCIHYKKEYLLIKQHTVEWQQLVKSIHIIF